MTTYHGGPQLDDAQSVLDRRAVSSADGLCVTRKVLGPCPARGGGQSDHALSAAASTVARGDKAGVAGRETQGFSLATASGLPTGAAFAQRGPGVAHRHGVRRIRGSGVGCSVPRT
jgi:hypothetical protein